MGWPQVTWIGVMVFGLTVAALRHGQPKGNWNVFYSATDAALYTGLLYAGGFFG